MKIAQIRSIIDLCNWSRQDLGGATAAEFMEMDVPARLVRHIDAVRALVIAPRFARDLENQAWALVCAEKTVSRWAALHG